MFSSVFKLFFLAVEYCRLSDLAGAFISQSLRTVILKKV